MTRTIWLACILGWMAAQNAAADESVDETRPATTQGVVSIDNLSGSVHVTGWSRKEVHVKGTLGEEVEKLIFDSEGERTRIVVDIPEHLHNKSMKSIESHLEVSVPAGSDVRVEGVNLEIAVGGVTGELDLQSVNGDVIANGKPEEMEISTVNGTITLNAAAGKTHLDAVNGAIQITGGSGELEASCVNGRIEVREGNFEDVTCSTVSGDLVWSAGLNDRGSLGLESHSGDILVEISGSLDADFDVSTFSGRIVNELGPEAKRTSEYAPGHELHFTSGSGSAEIDLSSFSGDITIRKKK
ncbi:MAG TPA: DUF4097 family beta strand repeat-containing protein [Candidatus Eisenbacteria bacterium]|nr:DUF4097 family beta strand repeat-containing protein [Candidatus Eisenbacteria bacterium]